MEQDYIFHASEFPGEVAVENYLKSETPSELINKLAHRLMKVITFKVFSLRNLIVLCVLSLVWVILTLLPHLGYNPFFIKILSLLTFSQGGASNSSFKIFGGLVGKSIFLVFITTFLDGSIKKIHQSIKPFIRGFKQKSKIGFGYLFLGIGVANIIFNFIVGYAALIRGIIGLVCFILILLALKSTRGFTYRFIYSILRKYKNIETKTISEKMNAILSGMGLGFIIGTLLSLVPYGYTPYFMGLLFAILSVLFFVLDKTMTKKVTILLILLLLMPFNHIKVSADTSSEKILKGQWVYKKTVYEENSSKLKDYYKNNPEDKTKWNYSIKNDKINLDFNYLGEGINDDLYEDALKNPENFIYIDIVLPNEFINSTININKPKKTFDQEEEIVYSFDFKIIDKKVYYFDDIAFYVESAGAMFNEYGMNFLEDDSKVIAKQFIFFEPFEYYYEPDITSEKGEFTGRAPIPTEEKDVFVIGFSVHYYIDDYYLDPDYSAEEELDYAEIFVYYFYQWERNSISSIGGFSEDFPGEEEDVKLSSIITTGALGVILASIIAGIGALPDEDKTKFMFYIKKDFDNVINYNKEIEICVKVVEQLENKEKERKDLTKEIDVYSDMEGFKIINKKEIDGYTCVKFIIELETLIKNECEISFKYYYDYGFIENKIIFQLNKEELK